MKVGKFFSEYGVIFAFLVLFMINVVTRGTLFLQPENLRNLISQDAATGVIAIGMTMVIIAGGIDLSVGSLTALCGAVVIMTINKIVAGGGGGSLTTTILMAGLASIAVGALAGLVNGVLVAYGRVAAFVVTLGGLAGFRSVALVLGRGGEIRSQLPSVTDFGLGGVHLPIANVELYYSAIIYLILAVVMSVVLGRTRFGRHVIAVGANRKAAEYSGINTRAVTTMVFMILGACVGLAALLVSSRMNSVGTGSVGLYYELDAIAAVVIGGTSLRGGKGRIWGTIVGLLMLTLINNMITAYHIDTNWQGLVKGAVILIAVLIQRGSKEDE